MSNTYFQFKQFTIHQDQCAMKVCTDACLFGAYVARYILEKRSTGFVLDIGSGTGLLSLMLAQKTTSPIDAVEIDEAAYQQAMQNFDHSSWKEKLIIYKTNILHFNTAKKYDFIISNPPFFEGDLGSADTGKNVAKHDAALTLQQLLGFVATRLSNDGCFAVLLPYHRLNHCVELARQVDLFCFKKVLIKQTPRHEFFRTVLFFGRQSPALISEEEITIKDEGNVYTATFTGLLQDYYLYL